MGTRVRFALLGLVCAVVGCQDGQPTPIAGSYHLDVERTALGLTPAARATFLRANRRASLRCDIRADGTWQSESQRLGEHFVRSGTWHQTEDGYRFRVTKFNGHELKPIVIDVVRDDIHLVWPENGETLYLGPGEPPSDGRVARFPRLPNADRDSQTKIEQFLEDCEAVEDGRADYKRVLAKYKDARVRWKGYVRGRGGQDVRISVGPIEVELPADTPGLGGMTAGSLVHIEGRIDSLNFSPWVHLHEARVLQVLASPGR